MAKHDFFFNFAGLNFAVCVCVFFFLRIKQKFETVSAISQKEDKREARQGYTVYTYNSPHCVLLQAKQHLKVRSWCFEVIIILLIYLRNCQKALFTKK